MKIDIQEVIFSELAKLDNQTWMTAEIDFDFSPTINKAYSGKQLFHDQNGQPVSVFLIGDEQFRDTLLRYAYFANQQNDFNRISVKAKKAPGLEIEVTTGFAREIVDNFENNLPRSMRGRTTPWWKNPEEVKNLF